MLEDRRYNNFGCGNLKMRCIKKIKFKGSSINDVIPQGPGRVYKIWQFWGDFKGTTGMTRGVKKLKNLDDVICG